MRSRTIHSSLETWIALALCAAVVAAGVVELLLPDRPAYAEWFAPDWLPLRCGRGRGGRDRPATRASAHRGRALAAP